MNQGLRNMSYSFQRLGSIEPVVAGNLSAVCGELAALGVAGQSAAGRVHLAGDAFERFTPADLSGFLDPLGTAQAVAQEKRQSARWLIITRNLLLASLILFTWLGLSWIISQYQVDLATHSADANLSFLALWQNGFGTGNLLLTFLFFVIVEASLLVLAIPAAVLAYIRKLRASLAGQRARAHLEKALGQLVPLLPPQSIPAASQMLVTQNQTLVRQIDRALDTTIRQVNTVATEIRQSGSDFRQGVDTFKSASAQIQQTTEKLTQAAIQMEEQTRELTQSVKRVERPIEHITQATDALSRQVQSLAAAQQSDATKLGNMLGQLQTVTQTMAVQSETSSKDLIGAIQNSDHLTEEMIKLQQRQIDVIGAMFTAQQQQLRALDDVIVQSLTVVTRSLDQTAQTIQRIESATRSATGTISRRLEDLRFSSFYPKEVQVETWQTISVYSYIAAALQSVIADAAKSIGQLGRLVGEVQARASILLSRGVEITIIPACEHVQFSPERVTFKWLEDWRPANFRFKAEEELLRSQRPIEITILAGPIIIASITMKPRFVREQSAQHPSPSPRASQPPTFVPRQPPPTWPSSNLPPSLVSPPSTPEAGRERAEATRYERVFASYSRKDTMVVLAYKDFCKALGITLFVDRDSLRPGKIWDKELKSQIKEADIFQLFWSRHSAKSENVQDEWEHALSLNKGEGFIRPVYWKNPPPTPPADLAKYHFVYTPLPPLSVLRRVLYRFGIYS
jgi:hypothetical protein